MTTPFPFQSAAVLTAAQMNAITTLPTSTKTASHTLTIADVSTRVIMNSASATTITVNTSIFGASDVVEILNIGAGVCTVTAGTCTVGTSGSLALAQNASGTLTFISASASVFRADGVTASAGALVYVGGGSPAAAATTSIDNVFNATYQNYLITYNLTTSSTMRIQLRVGGVTTVGSGYNSSYQYLLMTGAGNGIVVNGAVGYWAFQGASVIARGSFTLYQPFTTSTTSATFQNVSEDNQYTFAGGAAHTGSTSFDGLHFSLTSGTMTGDIRVYGISNL